MATVNLAGVTVGQAGKVSFQNAGVSADPSFTQNMPHVRFHNESGSGLNITFNLSQDSFTLPAGAWTTRPVIPGESGFAWNVLYNLPNPPVTLLFTDYYYPNEDISLGGVLGNSPIGIGGTIAVTNVTALSNETNPINTLVIDLGIPGNTNLVDIYNDHFVWKVLQAGVVHTVLTGEVSGNPLLLGQAGDTVEVSGSLQVDQNMTITGTQSTGTLTLTNGGIVSGGDWNLGTHGITASGLIIATTVQTNSINDSNGNGVVSVTASTVTRIQSSGTIAFQVPGGTTIANVTSTGVSANSYSLNAGSGTYGMYTNGISRISTGTYTSSNIAHATNHNLGAVPSLVIISGGSSAGTATSGADTYTATQFTSIEGAAGQIMRFTAIRF